MSFEVLTDERVGTIRRGWEALSIPLCQGISGFAWGATAMNQPSPNSTGWPP